MQSFYGEGAAALVVDATKWYPGVPAAQTGSAAVRARSEGAPVTQACWHDDVPLVQAATPSAPSQQRAQQNGSTSFYGEGLWTRRTLPPIFLAGGRRPDSALALDRQLRAAEFLGDFIAILTRSMPRCDIGNVVIALSCSAKLVDERTVSTFQAYPVWDSLRSEVLKCARSLEPRGLAMVAYAAAKLSWKDERLLAMLASVGTQKAGGFGATDIAKMCWAFAKFDYVEEAKSFWTAMEKEVQSKVHFGKFVDVSMIAWSFGTVELGSQEMFAEISRASLAALSELVPQSLSNIAWAFARVGVKDSELYRAICGRALLLVPDFVEFDVTNLCWALARADEADFELLDKLATHTVRMGFIKRFSSQMASLMAWAFAVTRVAHEPLFEELADFIAKHASVFDTGQLANCAWAYSAVDMRKRQAFSSIATASKGGKLWAFQPEELSALCWAFAEVRWSDEELFRDMVQVASQRMHEFEGQGLANLLSSLVGLRERGGAEMPDYFRQLLDQICSTILSGSVYLDAEALAVVAQSFCHVCRPEDAWSLMERLPETSQGEAATRQFYTALLADVERSGDANRQQQMWEKLAAGIQEPPVKAACSLCAVGALVQGGLKDEASQLLGRLASEGLFSAAARAIALRAGLEVPAAAAPTDGEMCWNVTAEAQGWPHKDQGQLLEGILSAAVSGTTASLLAVLGLMEELGAEKELLEIMAGGRATALDEVVASAAPHVTLELGTGVGYATTRIAAQVRRHGGCVITVEGNPANAAVARSIFEVAGVASAVRSIVGPVEECLREVSHTIGVHAVGLVVLHGGGEAHFAAQLEQAEELSLLAPGCTILADHILRPGAPRFLWRMHTSSKYSLRLVAVDEPGIGRGEDWMAICHKSAEAASKPLQEEEPLPPPELPSLTAESDRLWRRRQGKEAPAAQPRGRDPVAEKFTRRLQAFAARLELHPRRLATRVLASVPDFLLSSDGLPLPVMLSHSSQPGNVPPPATRASFMEEVGVRAARCEEEVRAGAHEALVASPSGKDLHSKDFKDWLLEVGPDGSLLEYLPVVQECYDTVAQIVRTYKLCRKGEECLDPQVFLDLGIEAAAHRSLFTRWFAEQCGLPLLDSHENGDSGIAVVATVALVDGSSTWPEEEVADLHAMPFEDWLSNVDPSGGLLVHSAALRESFDTVGQILHTYLVKVGGKQVFDVRFLEDIGVECTEHRALFERWFAGWCRAAEGTTYACSLDGESDILPQEQQVLDQPVSPFVKVGQEYVEAESADESPASAASGPAISDDDKEDDTAKEDMPGCYKAVRDAVAALETSPGWRKAAAWSACELAWASALGTCNENFDSIRPSEVGADADADRHAATAPVRDAHMHEGMPSLYQTTREAVAAVESAPAWGRAAAWAACELAWAAAVDTHLENVDQEHGPSVQVEQGRVPATAQAQAGLVSREQVVHAWLILPDAESKRGTQACPGAASGHPQRTHLPSLVAAKQLADGAVAIPGAADDADRIPLEAADQQMKGAGDGDPDAGAPEPNAAVAALVAADSGPDADDMAVGGVEQQAKGAVGGDPDPHAAKQRADGAVAAMGAVDGDRDPQHMPVEAAEQQAKRAADGDPDADAAQRADAAVATPGAADGNPDVSHTPAKAADQRVKGAADGNPEADHLPLEAAEKRAGGAADGGLEEDDLPLEVVEQPPLDVHPNAYHPCAEAAEQQAKGAAYGDPDEDHPPSELPEHQSRGIPCGGGDLPPSPPEPEAMQGFFDFDDLDDLEEQT